MKTLMITGALFSALYLSSCVTNVVEEDIQKTSTQDASMFTGLKVHRSSDDLRVSGWESDTIFVKADLSIWASDGEKARAIANGLEFSWAAGTPTAELIVTSNKADQELARLYDLSISAPSRLHLDLETSSGDISATNMLGNLALSTSSGNIIADTKGRITASTSDGDIVAACGRGATLDVSSGDIKLDITSPEFDGVSIDASSGDVTIYVADSAAVTFDLETSSGNISVNYSGTSTSTDNGSLRIDVNGGGRLIRVETSSGDIVVRTLR